MPNKANIINLIEDIKSRSKLEYKQVVAGMQSQLGIEITEDIFHSKFRRFPERLTTYDKKEIMGVILLFKDDKGKIVCTPLEALLLCTWAGLGFNLLHFLEETYTAEEISAVVETIRQVKVDIDDLDWSNFDVRKNVIEVFLAVQSQNQVSNPLGQVTRNPLPQIYISDYFGSQRLAVEDNPTYFPPVSLAQGIGQTQSLIQAGHYNNAERVLLKLFEMVKLKQELPHFELYHQFGILKIKQGHHHQAQSYLNSAIQMLSDNDQSAYIRVIANLGANEFYRGDFHQAQSYFEDVLSIAEYRNDKPVIGYLKNMLGVIALENQQFQQATQLLTDTKKISRQIDDRRRLSFAYMNMGILYEQQKQIEHAQKEFEASLIQANNIADPELYTHINWHLGSLLAHQGHLLHSEGLLKDIAAIATSLGLLWLEANILIELGRIYIQQHKFQVARTIISDALGKSVIIGNHELISRSLYGISLAILAEKYTIPTNSLTDSVRILKKELNELLFVNINNNSLRTDYLQSAWRYYQLNLVNFPHLSRYKILEALQVVFDYIPMNYSITS